MSVYRAASNYYIEMLDFIHEKKKKFGSLDNYMDNMNGTMKKEFMTKLSDNVLRLHMLFFSRQSYWNSKKKEQTAIFAIFIIIAIVIGLIFYLILVLRIKKEPAFKTSDGKSRNWNKIGKSFLSYTTVYMVILTVFVSMLKNSKKMMTFYQKEIDKAAMEGQFYAGFMFQAATIKIEAILFKLAYASRGQLNKDVELLSSDSQISDITSTFCKASKSSKQKQRNLAFYNCETQTANFEQAYDTMKGELKLAMNRFVNGPMDRPNIDGYIEVRQLYILSSPVPMLKETKRVIDSYYNLTLKEKNGKENKPPDADKQKAVIKSLIIDPISAILKQSDEVEPGAYEASQKLPAFQAEQKGLQGLFVSTAAYAYQVYMQKQASELAPAVRDNLPSKIPDVSDPARRVFDAHQTQKLGQYMKLDANDQRQISLAISELILDINGAFEPRYTSLLKILNENKINGSFVFDKETSQNAFMSTLKDIPGVNESYVNFMKDVMYENIIIPLKARVNMQSAGLGMIVESISASLVSQNINITKYNDYMLSEITKDMRSGDLTSKSSIVADTLSQISKSVAMKRQLKAKPQGTERYLDDADFVEVVDGMTFVQFKNTLETENINYIVNEFYKKISEAVNRKDETMENIYFNAAKQHDMWNTVIIMTTITIVLVWVNYFIGVLALKPYLHEDLKEKLKTATKDAETKRLAANNAPSDDKLTSEAKAAAYEVEIIYREKRNRTVNWIIRMIIPACFMIFIIAMMFGVLKKAKSKHEFNVDMIESNTSILRSAVDQLKNKVSSLILTIPEQDSYKKIKDLDAITEDNKIAIYQDMKSIIEKFEKCNFILESQKNQLPFPYSDVAMGGFMIFVTILCMLYVLSALKPVSRLKNIKDLNKLKAEAAIANMNQAKAIQRELELMIACHEDDIDAVVFTLKVVFFIFIVTFLIFYSTKVVTSSSDYKNGLYNSGYFETSNCVA